MKREKMIKYIMRTAHAVGAVLCTVLAVLGLCSVGATPILAVIFGFAGLVLNTGSIFAW